MSDQTAERRSHWERIYSSGAPDELSWYQARPALSLDLIRSSGAGPEARVLDVGGGDSLLVDHLLDEGFRGLTVLDVSARALERARDRLGDRAALVTWIAEDVTHFVPAHEYEVWHDRAVFHFLTEPEQRGAYRRALQVGVAEGGHVVRATFGREAPPKCSGLDVVRYDPDSLAVELGAPFKLVESREQLHITPRGVEQPFVYCRFIKSKR